jgi:hypothetical protein
VLYCTCAMMRHVIAQTSVQSACVSTCKTHTHPFPAPASSNPHPSTIQQQCTQIIRQGHQSGHKTGYFVYHNYIAIFLFNPLQYFLSKMSTRQIFYCVCRLFQPTITHLQLQGRAGLFAYADRHSLNHTTHLLLMTSGTEQYRKSYEREKERKKLSFIFPPQQLINDNLRCFIDEKNCPQLLN